jgi:branched-chain amino acid transport system substrate-binding protein
MATRGSRALCAGWLLYLALGLGGCGEPESIRLGFIGGLSGTNAELGTAGRNGAQLAVEQANASGGIDGRPLHLLIKDDRLDPEQGRQVIRELLQEQVAAILGPMTSAVAMAVVPLADEAQVLMMAGPVSSPALSGLDDYFFRTIGTHAEHARQLAEYLAEQHPAARTNLVLDLRNQAYSEAWAAHFSRHLHAAGGFTQKVLGFTSGPQTDYAALAAEALQGAPQVVLLITSAQDTALLCNQLRQRQPHTVLASAEWAGTGQLLELGGKAVEGLIVPHYMDLHSQLPAFQQFIQDYRQRFGHAPSFPALTTYNATRIVLQALAAQDRDEPLKQTLLRQREYAGLQGPIRFDAFGDTQGATYLTVIRDGQYDDAR